MKIHYLIPDRFGLFNLELPPSMKNKGGGASAKVQRVIEALGQYYEVVVTDSMPDEKADCILTDPIWFRFQEFHSPEYLYKMVEIYENYPARLKILCSTELALLELPYEARERIVQASSVVSTPCKWLSGLYNVHGITNVRLCDPVPSIFYNPNEKKTVSVVGMSLISSIKNSERILEIFKALEGKSIKRIYIGSADLWGEPNRYSIALEDAIRSNCDTFYRNLHQRGVATELMNVGAGIFDTYHDTGSESNLEALMSGVVGLYGSHGLWAERPGVHGLETADDFVDSLAELTDGFTKPPPKEKRIESEDWALQNCSYDHFLMEWRDLLAHVKD